jgi:hypothetical protein
MLLATGLWQMLSDSWGMLDQFVLFVAHVLASAIVAR